MHGSFSIGNRKVYSHRFAYEISRGPIPEGMVVMHSCDNGLCCNPLHLSLGTQSENIKDMHLKGRSNMTGLKNHKPEGGA